MSKRSWKSGAPSTRLIGRDSSGPGRSGAGRSAHSGSPSRQTAQLASASATGRPSCSIRTLSAVVDRPTRSGVTTTSTSPACGASMKCTVSDRGGRAGSPTASIIARTRNAEM